MDPVQIDDVLEVPAHQHINATHGSDGDVLGIGPHLGRDHPLSNVGFGEFHCLGIKLKSLDVRLGHRGKTPAHLVRGAGQFLHREGGHNEDELASDKALHEPDGILREFLVLAAPDHWRVDVDPSLHDFIVHRLGAIALRSAQRTANRHAVFARPG